MRKRAAIRLVVLLGVMFSVTACTSETPKAAPESLAADLQANVTEASSGAEQSLTADATNSVGSNSSRLAGIELGPNHLGDITLGSDAETAIGQLTELLGEPVADTGWTDELSPCEGMGSRSRNVEWLGIDATFATGPTLFFTSAKDHFAAYSVVQEAPNASRFLLSDRRTPFGRSVAELAQWNPKVAKFDSEIAGRIWSVGSGDNQLSGELDEQDRATSVRAGLFCFD